MAREDTDKKSNKSNKHNRFKVYTNVKQDIFDIEFPDKDQVHFIYPTEYLAQLSKLFGRTVDSHMLHLFKDAYGRHFVLERVPLSAEAVKQCKDDVHVFISKLLVGEYGLISAILHELMYRVNGSNDRNLQILFNAYLVIFYRATNKQDEYKQAMELLEASKEEFNNEHLYWYYREQGVIKRRQMQYKDALAQFLKAEELIEQVHIHVTDRILYFNIGFCLTFMRFTTSAIEYLDESERLAAKGFNGNSNNGRAYTQLLYAINYIAVGDTTKSLALLESLKRDEMDAITKGKFNALFYSYFAEVYYELGQYEKAIYSMDDAVRYCKNTKFHAGYKYYVYMKASMLDKLGRISECYYELDDAIETKSEGEQLTDLLLNTLKHSLRLDNAESLSFVADYAINKLLDYGLIYLAIEYHKKICIYYSTDQKSIKCYEKALYHAFEIDKLRIKLSKKGGYLS